MTGSSMEGSMGEDISSMVGCLQGEGVHWSTCLSVDRGWSGCCVCWCIGKGSKQLEQKQQCSSLAAVEEHSWSAQGRRIHVGGKRKCRKNGKGLVLFGPCWPNLGFNSDLNGAQKKVGIGLELSWG